MKKQILLSKKVKRQISVIFVFLIFIIFVCSCADATPIEACRNFEPYGFWNGIWHGTTSWFSFFGSLLNEDIVIYSANNNGGWYDFGFVLGAGIVGGGLSKLTSNK